jgi:hypothetical protein
VRQLTGFDRVMACRFRHGGNFFRFPIDSGRQANFAVL